MSIVRCVQKFALASGLDPHDPNDLVCIANDFTTFPSDILNIVPHHISVGQLCIMPVCERNIEQTERYLM
jgi:hypothetical protein